MNIILSALLGSAVRHAAQIVASAIVTSGLLSQNDAATVVGAAGILLSLGWSQVDAFLKAKKIKLLGK